MYKLYTPPFFDHLTDEHPCDICGTEMYSHGYKFYCPHCKYERHMSLYCLAVY